MAVLAGRAAPRTVPVSLRPLVEAFQAMLPLPSEAVAAELEPFRRALGQLLPQLADDSARGEVELLVVAEGVARLVAVAGRAQGALLVLRICTGPIQRRSR
jgi:hypothetical protein